MTRVLVTWAWEGSAPGSPPGRSSLWQGPGDRAALPPESQCALATPPPCFPEATSGAAGCYRLRHGVSGDVAMVTLGSLLSNGPELQEVAKVFSHVLKQMAVYLNFEYKYTVGGKEKTYTHKPPAVCMAADP